MAHFQDSRFLGFSGRTLWVTLVIAAVVVGLFFIPETIKFALKSGKAPGSQKSTLADAKKKGGATKSDVDAERAALSPDALRAISSNVETSGGPARTAAPSTKKVTEDDAAERPGLFSGWNFKVKAGESTGGVVQVPKSMSLDKLGSKEFSGLLKQSRVDVKNFSKRKFKNNPDAEEIVETFVDQLELGAREAANGMGAKALFAGLQDVHIGTIQNLSAAGVDRGTILEWLKVPIVAFVDDKLGLDASDKVRDYFAPRLVLRNVSVKQRAWGGWGADGRVPATARVELAYKGSDIEKLVVFANGKRIASTSGPRAGETSYRTLKANGDAAGVWTFVAYDRFGNNTFWKSYSFFPRARRFPQSRSGDYLISFRPESAPNSLDKFFLVGSSALSRKGDPMISSF